jgi:hypothetical protein
VVAVVATGLAQAVQVEVVVAVVAILQEQLMVVAQVPEAREMLAPLAVRAELILEAVAAEPEQQVAQLVLAGTAMAEMDYLVVSQDHL